MPRTIYEKSDVIALLAEVFRELGYEGASLGAITKRTGVSKGSLYHFFPGGKEDMAAAVVEEIDTWFRQKIYEPLERDEPKIALERMWLSVDGYFRSGRRACLLGAFALDATRDRFSLAIRDYFVGWIQSLMHCFMRAGVAQRQAEQLAEDVVSSIQGGLVLTRALGDRDVFARIIERLRETIDASLHAG